MKPTGTVTFLFSDIEGSTSRWDRHRAAMQSAVRAHDRIMRAEIEAGGGHIFKTIGDAFCAAFVTPEAATAAALAAQRALDGADFSAVDGLHVRMAINTGTADERDGDYFGPTVNRVARLLALGHGGQVLLSGIAASLVSENPPPQTSLAKLGDFALKDLDRPETVYQLVAPGLHREFPALRSGSLERPWVLPTALRTHYFTGRETLLAALHQQLSEKRRAALSGLGGVGKTQLALEYAVRHRKHYPHGVFWVNAETVSGLMNSFVEIVAALKLAAAAASDQEHAIRAALEWFNAHDGWLLILDNVESGRAVQRFVPDKDKGHVLITSRESVFQALGIARGLEVRDLDAGEALQFFLARTGRENSEPGERAAAMELAAELGNLPLALEQAAAYITETDATFGEYATSFRKRRMRLLDRSKTLVSHESVAVTWAANFEAIESESPAAADILRISALLAPDAIPFELFLKGSKVIGGAIVAEIDDADDALSMRELLRPLSHYSLVRADEAAHSFGLHRLVQEIVRASMGDAGCRRHAQHAVQLLNAVFPDLDLSVWAQCDRLLPHVVAICPWIETYDIFSVDGGRLLTLASRFLHDRGRYSEAEPLVELALAIRERALGPDHVDVAETLNVVGANNVFLGHFDRAQASHERALTIREHEFGPEHPNIGGSLSNLANVHFWCGRYAQAEPLYRRALAVWERKLGPWDRHVATALNNLAETNNELGRPDVALRLHERSLAIREKALGPDHYHVALSYRNFGVTNFGLGKYEEACTWHERGLALRERVLGPDHTDTAESLRGVAQVRMKQGRTAEALALYERALAIHERSMGPDHPTTGESLADIADVRCVEGRFADAEASYRRALAIIEKGYGENHPMVARVLIGLADVNARQGRSADAEALYRRAQTAIETFGGPDHPSLSPAFAGLASIYEAQGRKDEAIALLERAISVRERIFDADHPELVALRERISAMKSAV
jgi:class 3 adenylate cyclase/tetratricopeptide (TPR) repeat protein